MNYILASIISVLIISILSFVGILTFSIKAEKLRKVLIYMIAFSAGALFGDAFLHLLPELIESSLFSARTPFLILAGISLFFILEKVVHWQHCHMPPTKEHVHPFSIMNLIGDAVHNLIDGLIIGASYMANIPAGIATTIAIALHEIPQEIGDFSVLLHGGFSRKRALLMNFLTALSAFVGLALAIWLGTRVENITSILIPIAIGGFIYIAGSDLIPELHKEFTTKRAILQTIAFILGILVMSLLLLLE